MEEPIIFFSEKPSIRFGSFSSEQMMAMLNAQSAQELVWTFLSL